MSTTKFMTATGSNRELQVKGSAEGHVQIRQFDPDFYTHQAKTFFLNPSDAPALCLAILEAAGYKGILASEEPGNLIEKAYSAIRLHIKEQESITAEAREQAELKAEAFNLYRTYMAVHEPMNAIGDWQMLAEGTKEEWLAVARCAREMRAEK